jgi:hypothetical protein
MFSVRWQEARDGGAAAAREVAAIGPVDAFDEPDMTHAREMSGQG